MTDVQSAVLADSCHERDLLVSAQTGSGKTVAFGLSMASQLLGPDAENDFPSQPASLIITPTRELALQVKTELDWLYAETGLVLASAVGGMDIRAERRALSGRVDILIGTPGRLVDHLNRNSFDPDNLRVVVLDEADEMLDMGFREDLETLLRAAPEQRRTLMFSATVPRTIAALAADISGMQCVWRPPLQRNNIRILPIRPVQCDQQIARMRLLICCAFMMIKGCYFLRHTGVSVLSCHTAC